MRECNEKALVIFFLPALIMILYNITVVDLTRACV